MNVPPNIPFSQTEFPSGKRANSDAMLHRRSNASLSQNVARFLGGFLVVLLCAGLAWPLLPRRYESTASVILRPTDDQGRLESIQSLRQPLDDNAIQSEMDIIGSPTIASAVIAKHQLASDPEFAGDPNRLSLKVLGALYRVFPAASAWFGEVKPVSEASLRDQLQKHLSVSRDRRSYTVKMGYWSNDPAKAASLTDSLLKAYLDNQLARKRASAEQQSAWLVERVDVLRAKLENSRKAVRDFSLQSDLTDSAMLASLESQRAALGAEAADLRNKIALATAPTEAPSTRTRAGLALQSSNNADVQALETREAVVQKAIRALREEVADRRLAALKFESLNREAAIDKELLDSALVRLKEQAPRSSSVGPGVEILSRPDPALRPSFPNALLFFIGTLVAAIAAGAAMVWAPRLAGSHRAPIGR